VCRLQGLCGYTRLMQLPRIISFLLALTAGLGAQTLRVPSSKLGHDGGIFTIFLESPDNKAPVALQWDFTVPAALSIKIEDVKAGDAAKGAGKSVVCAPRKASATPPRYTCILAGGTKAIPNGAIASVRYTAAENPGGAPIRVAIDSIIGTSKEAARIEIAATQAIITFN